MSLFHKSKRGKEEGISTASLPDIVFMLLFFFMVATVLRDENMLVKVIQPDASEAIKLTNRSLVSHIYIGKPYDMRLGDVPRIQLNDALCDTRDVGPFAKAEIIRRNEADKSKTTFSLEVDELTEMGIVTDVKQELRKADALKINYSARKELRK